MKHWLVRADSRSILVHGSFQGISIKTRRRPRISAGDRVVLFTGMTRAVSVYEAFPGPDQVEGDPLMRDSRRATVDGLDDGTVEGNFDDAEPDRQPSWYSYSLEEVAVDVKNADVESLRFSLTFVRNLNNPQVHFRRGYRAIPEADYKTIVSGEAFIARSWYYELLLAIPRPLRATFEGEELTSSEGLFSARGSFKSRFQRLYEFLSIRILEVGKQLEVIEKSLKVLNLTDSFEHEFVLDGATGRDRIPDSFERQLERFNALENVLKIRLNDEVKQSQVDVIQQVLSELDQSERQLSESRFERLFRRMS